MGTCTHISFSESPAYILTLSSLRKPEVAGSSPFTLMSLAIPDLSAGSVSGQVQSSFGLIGEV